MPAVSAHVPRYCHFKPRGLAYVRIRGRIRYLCPGPTTLKGNRRTSSVAREVRKGVGVYMRGPTARGRDIVSEGEGVRALPAQTVTAAADRQIASLSGHPSQSHDRQVLSPDQELDADTLTLSIRPMVVAPRCSPAQASVWAILTLPIVGGSVLSLWTACRTNSGNLFTGSGIRTRASGPSLSRRRVQDAMVADVTRNAMAVCASDQPLAARSSRIAIRSMGVYCGLRCGGMRAMGASLIRTSSRTRASSCSDLFFSAVSRTRAIGLLTAQPRA
jgi:hypothetical protein